MSLDLISVIVPVYKTEAYLQRCVDSLLAQTYPQVEILLVDDGSPDGCPLLCDQLAQQHPQVRAIHKENGGLSSARNAGIEASQGAYLAFVDSDDCIDSEMLARLHELAAKHSADVAMVQYAEVTDDSVLPAVVKAQETVYHGAEIPRAFLELKIESVCVALYARSAIGQHRFPHGKTSEDIPFNFAVFQELNTFVYAPEKRYYYYYHEQSISNGCLDRNMFNYLHFREEIYRHYLAGSDQQLTELAEVLYARAAMGLLTRMAVWGIAPDLDAKQCRTKLTAVLREHKGVYFRSKTVPLSRKIVGFCDLYAYSLLKLAGRIKH